MLEGVIKHSQRYFLSHFQFYRLPVYIAKYYSGDLIKKIEIGRTCSTYESEEMCIQDFGG